MLCSRCNFTNESDSLFCANCGAPLEVKTIEGNIQERDFTEREFVGRDIYRKRKVKEIGGKRTKLAMALGLIVILDFLHSLSGSFLYMVPAYRYIKLAFGLGSAYLIWNTGDSNPLSKLTIIVTILSLLLNGLRLLAISLFLFDMGLSYLSFQVIPLVFVLATIFLSLFLIIRKEEY